MSESVVERTAQTTPANPADPPGDPRASECEHCKTRVQCQMTSLAGICGPLAVGQSPRPFCLANALSSNMCCSRVAGPRSANLTGHKFEADLACRKMTCGRHWLASRPCESQTQFKIRPLTGLPAVRPAACACQCAAVCRKPVCGSDPDRGLPTSCECTTGHAIHRR
jgi:hypothetical protein